MLEAGLTESMHRSRITVQGAVQGVGFRPFVYRLAGELRLAGFVRNDSAGVTIEVEGPHSRLDLFRDLMTRTGPPLSKIDHCRYEPIEPVGEVDFAIMASRPDGRVMAQIPPDVAVCEDCLRELFDPADRRYRYPFINCTNCGPRFTIVDDIPYDRPNSTMKTFVMCDDCKREYKDPADRRFHAQPIACHKCGPGLSLHNGRRTVVGPDPLAAAVDILREGKVLALRGLGGFHLAVDATNEQAVGELRRRKGRERKPLAMMAPDLERIRKFCFVSSAEAKLLTDRVRPIVLLRRKTGTPIASSVAYDDLRLGFMLPYTPLHHLLLREKFDALVMTSGNLSEEPIAIGNQEALERLAGIADCFLLHNREINQRCDDSVVHHAFGRPRLIRRSRGFVPDPIRLSHTPCVPVLACGGDLKAAVALSRGDEVVLSQYLGDLENRATLDFFEESIKHLQQLLKVKPKLIAHDLHTDYISRRWALRQADLPTVGVQHHHAHLVSVMAENQVTDPAIGIILDGTGYGPDGTIWGGEVLVGGADKFKRFAWLEPVPMPGSTAAIRQPWRMGLSYLDYAFGERLHDLGLPLLEQVPVRDSRIILEMMRKQLNSPLTSSCGRLFDGVSAIVGLCLENSYEAQAAVALETAAGSSPVSHSHDISGGVPTAVGAGPLRFDWLIRDVVEGVGRGESCSTISIRFHIGLAELFVRSAVVAREQTGIDRVALSGGVYQNTFFFEYIMKRLHQEQFDTLTHTRVPTNDGGLALGQLVIGSTMAANSTWNTG